MNSSVNLLKELNKNQLSIIDVLLREGEMSKNQIAKKLNMKLTSLNNILYPMKEKEIILESIHGESKGGRRPVLYRIPEEKFLVIGIDISIMYVMVVLTDIKMNVIYQEQFEIDNSYTLDEIIDRIANIISKIAAKYDKDGKKLLGIGVGTVGKVNMGNKKLDNNEYLFLNDLNNKNVKNMMEERINKNVIWQNGVNVAGLLEVLYGCGREHKNFGYFNCGFGIRVGAIASNQIICSMNNEEEAFSKLLVLHDDHTIHEIGDYITIKAINDNYIRKSNNDKLRNISALPLFKLIVSRVDEGDIIAKEVIEEAARIMGIGITNFITLLNTDLIILAGPLIMNCPMFYDKCISVVKENITSKLVEFNKMGKYSYSAIALGAANMVIQKLLRNNF